MTGNTLIVCGCGWRQMVATDDAARISAEHAETHERARLLEGLPGHVPGFAPGPLRTQHPRFGSGRQLTTRQVMERGEDGLLSAGDLYATLLSWGESPADAEARVDLLLAAVASDVECRDQGGTRDA